MRRTPVLIVGGGPAGAAVAITLARAGAPVELIDRSTSPRDVVCGGFLGWDALAALRRLGIDVAALGARPITRLRLVSGRRVAEAALPRAAAGLSRRRLDSALLDAAQGGGAIVARGRSARTFEERSVRLDDGEEIAPDSLFLATGKHELRGIARALAPEHEPLAAGLRTALPIRPDLETGLEGTIELHGFDGGYAGLLLQEDGAANLCLSVSRRRLADAGGPDALIAGLAEEAPLLLDRIGAARPDWQAVAGIPYGWSAQTTDEGIFRVGDQAAVIASLAGDGIAVALASGVAAAQAWRERGPAAAPLWQRDFAIRAERPLRVAERLRHAAERRATRAAMVALMRLVPGAARIAARLTRI